MKTLSVYILVLLPCFFALSCNQNSNESSEDTPVKEEVVESSINKLVSEKNSDKMKIDPIYTLRHEQIRSLYQAVEHERNSAYKEGLFDGSGMLYRSMDSFQKLKTICSAQELMIIETLLGPPVYARPDSIDKQSTMKQKNAEQIAAPDLYGVGRQSLNTTTTINKNLSSPSRRGE